MSKANREKRANSQCSAFPFRLLQYWIKPFVSGLPCPCGKEAGYSVHCFIDPIQLIDLVRTGKTEQAATDIVWDKALSKQLQGNYTVEHITHNCESCIYVVLEKAVGDNAAKLAMLPMMMLGELSSVVIGAELSSRDDDGKNFAGMASAQNLDELLVQLKGKVLPINLAK